MQDNRGNKTSPSSGRKRPGDHRTPRQSVKTARSANAARSANTVRSANSTRSANAARSANSTRSANTARSANRTRSRNASLKKKGRYARQRRQRLILAGSAIGIVVIVIFAVFLLSRGRHRNEENVTEMTAQADAVTELSAQTDAMAETSAQTDGTSSDMSGTAPGSENDGTGNGATQTELGQESAGSGNASVQNTLTEPVSIKVTVVGDCTLGKDDSFDYSTSFNAYYDANGPEYFFRNVKDIFEDDDLTIANCETTLTTSEDHRDDVYFTFKADPEYVKIFTSSSVEAVTTANNHAHDYFDKGYEDTIATLDKAGVVNFGYEKTAVMDVKGVKVGLVGIYEIIDHLGCADLLKTNIQKVKDEGAQLIIVIFHWGNELDIEPDSNQTTLARLAVDLGADLVCGHHAHVIQGIENYKGKNICYGLANFCFGGNTHPTDMDTIIFQQTFTVTPDGVAEDNVTNIIPCSVSSDYGYNNYQPTPQTGEDAERILNKLKERTESLPV